MVQVPGGAGGGLNQIEFLLRIAADATGAVQASQGLQQVQKQADRTASSITRAFGPRVITQMTQVRGKLVEQGQALVGFGKGLQTSEQLSGRLRTQLEGTGKGLVAMGVAQTKAGQAGRANAEVMQTQAAEMARASGYIGALTAQEEQHLQTLQRMAAVSQTRTAAQKNAAAAVQAETAVVQENIRVLRLHAATLEQGAANQAVFAQQTQRATLTMGSFSGESTFAQKAGQGMILSFSAAQAAAGNFQQSLFGLGFSLLFVGRSLLGWPLIIAGVATALTMGIPALMGWIRGGEEAETVSERMQRRMEELEEAVSKVKGPYVELAEAQARLAEQGGPVFETLVQQLTDVQTPSEDTVRLLSELGITLEELATVPVEDKFLGMTMSSHETRDALEALGVENQELLRHLTLSVEGIDWFTAAVKNARGVIADYTLFIRDQRMAIQEQLFVNIQQQVAVREEIEQNTEREAALKRVTTASDTLAEATREGAEALIEARRETGQEEVDAARAALEAETTVRGDALQDWITERRAALQESIGIIDEERDAAVRAAQDASAARIDALEEERDKSVKAAQDASAARIDVIEKERDRAIEVSREKVTELRELERQLVAEVRDLESQRRQALQDILVTEAEIAEIESILRKFGPDPALEAELALRKARLAALAEARREMEEEISVREDAMSTIDDQIESEEERQKAVRETAQDAIEAEREAAQERIAEIRGLAQDAIEAERRSTQDRIRKIRELAQQRSNSARAAANAEIVEMQRSVRAQLNSLRAGVTAQIREINRRRDADIDAIEDARDAQIAFIEKTRDARIAVIDISSEQRRLNRLLREAVDLRAREAFLMTATAQQMELIGNMREWARVQIGRGVSPETITQQLLGVAGAVRLPEDILRILLAELGLPQFQHGGVVPGPPGAPRLIIAHGGEPIGARANGVAPITVVFQVENLYVNKPSDLDRITRSVNRGLGRKTSLGLRTGRYLS